jgi:hypothetical protein
LLMMKGGWWRRNSKIDCESIVHWWRKVWAVVDDLLNPTLFLCLQKKAFLTLGLKNMAIECPQFCPLFVVWNEEWLKLHILLNLLPPSLPPLELSFQSLIVARAGSSLANKQVIPWLLYWWWWLMIMTQLLWYLRPCRKGVKRPDKRAYMNSKNGEEKVQLQTRSEKDTKKFVWFPKIEEKKAHLQKEGCSVWTNRKRVRKKPDTKLVWNPKIEKKKLDLQWV